MAQTSKVVKQINFQTCLTQRAETTEPFSQLLTDVDNRTLNHLMKNSAVVCTTRSQRPFKAHTRLHRSNTFFYY